MAKRMTLDTHRFGRVEVSEQELIDFEEILGFPHARRFFVRQHDHGSVFAWMISADAPDLAFVIANPWHFFPDYTPEIAPHYLKALRAKAPEEVEIVTLVTVGEGTLSFNLAGPILINPDTRRGLQAILDGKDHSAAATIPSRPSGEAPAPEASSGGPSPPASRG